MGRKSRKKRERRGEGPKKPVLVERTQVGPIVMERMGRHVHMRSLLDEAGAARMRQHLRDAVPKMRDDVDAGIAEVAAICRRVNPFELLTVSSLTNCAGDPEQYSESSFRGREAHAEYLLSMALAIPNPTFDVHAEEGDFLRIKELVEKIFELAPWTFKAMSLDEDRLHDPMQDLCADVFLMNLLVRGHSFQEHHVDLVRRVFEPHDTFFLQHFGVSARNCVDGMVEVANQINSHFTEVMAAARAIREAVLKLKEGVDDGKDGDEAMSLLAEREELVRRMHEFRTALTPERPYEITPNAKAPREYLERVSCSWGDNADFLQRPKWGGWPSTPSIVTEMPIIRHAGKFYSFVPQLLDRHTFTTFEGWIRDADPAYFDRSYQKVRGQVLEKLALGYLGALLPGCMSYQQLHYVYEHDGVSERGELDGLVIFDGVVFVVEAKAGLFTPSAKRGGEERIRKHIKDLIDKAYEQGKRALAYIRSNDQVTFQDDRGRDVLTLRADDYERFILVNVTLDCQERIMTQLNSLRAMSFLQGQDWPWTIFVNDLRVISEIVDSPSEFLLYLDRRIQANDVPEFGVFDELDYLMHFLKHGLFLEKLDRGENLHYGLTGYTEDLDRYYDFIAGRVSSGEKPRLAIPDKMRVFVRQVEQCGSPGYSGVGARLLMYDYDEQVRVWNHIDRIVATCVADGRDHDITLASRANHGVSIIASQEVEATLWPRIVDFARLRQYETKAETWDIVVLLVKPNGDYQIALRVLRGVPEADADLDRRVQEQRDRRFRRAVAGGGTLGRNDPCPCGSGKKFKRCHGA